MIHRPGRHGVSGYRYSWRLDARRSVRPNAGGTASGGIIETIAGAAPFQKPVNALKTGFGWGLGIVEDGTGNLYVASCDLGVVLKIDRILQHHRLCWAAATGWTGNLDRRWRPRDSCTAALPLRSGDRRGEQSLHHRQRDWDGSSGRWNDRRHPDHRRKATSVRARGRWRSRHRSFARVPDRTRARWTGKPVH